MQIALIVMEHTLIPIFCFVGIDMREMKSFLITPTLHRFYQSVINFSWFLKENAASGIEKRKIILRNFRRQTSVN